MLSDICEQIQIPLVPLSLDPEAEAMHSVEEFNRYQLFPRMEGEVLVEEAVVLPTDNKQKGPSV